MTITLDAPLAYAFFLALVRASAWLLLAPPFSTKAIPNQVKAGLAAALAFAAAPMIHATPPTSTAPMIASMVLQVVIGAALGFLSRLMLEAITSAGAFIGLASGINSPPSLDPLGLNQQSVVGNLFEMLLNTLLVVSGGFLVLTRGFLLSFQTRHTGGSPSIESATQSLAQIFTSGMAQFFLAALEIAAPVAVVMLVIQAAIGLASKASPQLNVLGLAFPIQNLLALFLIGGVIVALPNALDTLVGRSIQGMQDVATALS